MVGMVGATGSNNCDIYQSGSTSYKSCQSLTDTTKTSVKVVCVNNVYVIDNNSQNAGTGNATITSNGSGGYAASGNAQNTSGSTVTIGASCGQAATSSSSTPPSTSGGSSSTPTTTKKSSSPSAPLTPSSSTAMSAASLPETGSNTLVNAAVIGTVLVVGGLAISFVGTALYRRAALK